LTPKTNVDRGIVENLAHFAAGRAFGPFKTDKDLISSLRRECTEIRSEAGAKHGRA
jgi:hypothetical protein